MLGSRAAPGLQAGRARQATGWAVPGWPPTGPAGPRCAAPGQAPDACARPRLGRLQATGQARPHGVRALVLDRIDPIDLIDRDLIFCQIFSSFLPSFELIPLDPFALSSWETSWPSPI